MTNSYCQLYERPGMSDAVPTDIACCCCNRRYTSRPFIQQQQEEQKRTEAKKQKEKKGKAAGSMVPLRRNQLSFLLLLSFLWIAGVHEYTHTCTCDRLKEGLEHKSVESSINYFLHPRVFSFLCFRDTRGMCYADAEALFLLAVGEGRAQNSRHEAMTMGKECGENVQAVDRKERIDEGEEG